MTTPSPAPTPPLGPDPADAKARAAAATFAQRFGRPARFAAIAPGRVNLIGEHTDYNEGFVFPMAIDRHVAIVGTTAAPAAGKKEPPRLRVFSAAMQAEVDIPLAAEQRPGDPGWANYLRGVVGGFVARGVALPSLDLLIAGDLPAGAGLASSAALEVALATLLEAVAGQPLAPMDKARLCQEAEQKLAGVPCGIMDQATASLAREGAVLLIDCSDETVRAVPLPPGLALIVADTGVRHDLPDGSYARRQAECAAAAHALGVASLRAASPASVEAASGRLDPVLYRRALHVVSENVRTLAMAACLLRGDAAGAGRFMYASHVSLRDDFEVSCPELDALTRIADDIGPTGGVLGARLTGAGFGGATVTLVEAGAAPHVVARLASEYQQRTGKVIAPFVAQPVRAAHAVDLGAPR